LVQEQCRWSPNRARYTPVSRADARRRLCPCPRRWGILRAGVCDSTAPTGAYARLATHIRLRNDPHRRRDVQVVRYPAGRCAGAPCARRDTRIRSLSFSARPHTRTPARAHLQHAMNLVRLRELLDSVAAGRLTPAAAAEQLKLLPFEDLGFAKLDHHRALRNGLPEVIFGQGKSAAQIIAIAQRQQAHGDD